MFRALILTTLIPAILATEGLQICNSRHDMPSQTTVIGCDSAPCEVLLGGSARMEIIFTAPRTINTLTPVATAFLLGIGVPYELPPHIQVGCDHLENQRCPIPAGTRVTYNFELPVSSNYPAVRNMPVEVALQDEQGTFSCVRVRITALGERFPRNSLRETEEESVENHNMRDRNVGRWSDEGKGWIIYNSHHLELKAPVT
ncbi:hypothetical protein DMENIID0001_031300 [Sergentomyia squamirostris]